MREGVPTATYRLQLHPKRMTLHDAAALTRYVHELGVSHLYVSPLAAARRGSEHGYDVTDPRRVNPALGGMLGLRALAESLRAHGMGLIVDWVPHHMAAHPDNPWWRSVLRWGRASPYAGYFDIRWDFGRPEGREGRLLLPVLARPYGEELRRGAFRVDVGPAGPSVRYGSLELPLHPDSWKRALRLYRYMENGRAANGGAGDGGTESDDASRWGQRAAAMHALLRRQRYTLAAWRSAGEAVNYRRFFAVNELAALRMEKEAVFAHYHRGLAAWAKRGWIQGLRIDHIDGLYDPEEYLRRLHRTMPRAARCVLVEKILSPGEKLPRRWLTAGTTGYDFLNALQRAFIHWDGFAALEDIYREFTGEQALFADIVYTAKKQCVDELFGSTVALLTRRLERMAAEHPHGQDITGRALREALVELTVALPVYRTYLDGEKADPLDRVRIDTALAQGRRRRPDVDGRAFDFLRLVFAVAAGRPDPYVPPRQARRFVMEWQQFTGPVMAKGVEDTALYRFFPLAALNEVGGHPEPPRGGARRAHPRSVSLFHRLAAARRELWPGALNATSTHDTKRSEDVRCRIAVLADVPSFWRGHLTRWHGLAAAAGVDDIDRKTEVLLYQTLLGAWPLTDIVKGKEKSREGGEAHGAVEAMASNALSGEPVSEAFAGRIDAYMLKAVREANERTGWHRPDAGYEQAVSRVVHRLLREEEGAPFRRDMRQALQIIAPAGAVLSLGQLAVKGAAPGVPDIYQGCEVWDFSLVDPDNRRPVDFEALRQRLRRLQQMERSMPRRSLAEELLENWTDGTVKLYVTYRLLRWRREKRALFSHGEYIPLAAGPQANPYVIAFARRWKNDWALVGAPRLVGQLAAEDGHVSFSLAPFAAKVADALRGAHMSLPGGAPARWRHLFTDEELLIDERSWRRGRGARLPADALFARFPVAVWAGQAD